MARANGKKKFLLQCFPFFLFSHAVSQRNRSNDFSSISCDFLGGTSSVISLPLSMMCTCDQSVIFVYWLKNVAYNELNYYTYTYMNTFTYIWGVPRQIDWHPHFFFIQVCYWWPQKNTYTDFQIFFVNFFVNNCRNWRFGTEVRYRFFWNLHYKFFD